MRISNTEDNIISYAEHICKFAYKMVGKLPCSDPYEKEEIVYLFKTVLEHCE